MGKKPTPHRTSVHPPHLSVGDDADDGAVPLHLLQVPGDLLLAGLIGPLLGRLGEGLLLGGAPVDASAGGVAERGAGEGQPGVA